MCSAPALLVDNDEMRYAGRVVVEIVDAESVWDTAQQQQQ
jgi:hypothetical protein